MTRRRPRRRTTTDGVALAISIDRGEWERVALNVFVAIAETLRGDPGATIDDLLDLLEDRGASDER